MSNGTHCSEINIPLVVSPHHIDSIVYQDVVKQRIQIAAKQTKGSNFGSFKAAQILLKEEGARGFYKVLC